MEFKSGVQECYQDIKTFKGCNGGKHHVHANTALVTVVNGVITATPVPHASILATDQYILTPKKGEKEIVWTASGDGVKKGYAE